MLARRARGAVAAGIQRGTRALSSRVEGVRAVVDGDALAVHVATGDGVFQARVHDPLGPAPEDAAAAADLIAVGLQGVDPTDQSGVDKRLRSLEGSADWAELSKAVVHGVSVATARAGASAMGRSLHTYLAELAGKRDMGPPLPIFLCLGDVAITPLRGSLKAAVEAGSAIYAEVQAGAVAGSDLGQVISAATQAATAQASADGAAGAEPALLHLFRAACSPEEQRALFDEHSLLHFSLAPYPGAADLEQTAALQRLLAQGRHGGGFVGVGAPFASSIAALDAALDAVPAPGLAILDPFDAVTVSETLELAVLARTREWGVLCSALGAADRGFVASASFALGDSVLLGVPSASDEVTRDLLDLEAPLVVTR